MSHASHALVAIDEFREAMRTTASGVAIVATDGPGGRAGVTVSSLCSLSMEPPSVVFSLHRDNRYLAKFLENGVFVANVLCDAQERVANSFAGLIPELRDDRFRAGDWSTMLTGAPALDGSLCNFDCRIASLFDFGSHRIVAGEVLQIRTRSAPPLIYSDRGFRRLAVA
ncbi:flavin reductase family protein [Bradyrhizobium sp. BRP22]|uniref:flavin reductase family protein n=1 Tax=Bradyrhizobium sp. BRP22 TaxID=2793821 RepID=UPI001CD3AA19